jgi:heme oxygenase (mycobilin-producing)
MISVIHLRPPAQAVGGPDDFSAQARLVLAALAARPGYLRGTLGRATDDEDAWVLITEWESVGAYRRGLGGYEVKLVATPFMAHAEDRPSAFETLVTIAADGAEHTTGSDRAVDADWTPRHP